MDHQVEQHLMNVLTELKNAEASWPFIDPVDWKGLHLDDYPIVVTEPMDLKKVRKKLKSKQYRSPSGFWKDISLIWSNCKTYNSETAEVFHLALEMEDLAKALKASFKEQTQQEEQTNTVLEKITDEKLASQSSSPRKTKGTSEEHKGKDVFVKEIRYYVRCFYRLHSSQKLTVIQQISENAKDCLSEEPLLPVIDRRKVGQKNSHHHDTCEPYALKLHLDLGRLFLRYPIAYDQSLRMIRSLMHSKNSQEQKKSTLNTSTNDRTKI